MFHFQMQRKMKHAELMAANKTFLKPQNGEPITEPKYDMVLGAFWMTKDVDGEKGEGTDLCITKPRYHGL